MSQPGERRLQPVPGFPPAQSYAQYQFQLQQYHQQQAQAQAALKPTSQWKGHVLNMGMGFGMGLFIGGSVTLLHTVMAKMPLDNMAFKRALAGGSAFGVIFAFGSLVRPQ